MDKKELNGLIDRVALTGPGGTDLIKKILKKIVNEGQEDGDGSGCNCPGAMFVHGTTDEGDNTTFFVPNSGEPSSSDAMKHIENGGTLYIVVSLGVGIEFTAPLAFIQTMKGTTGLGFMVDEEDYVVWFYEPEPDFSVNIDFNNPSIDGDTKYWFTTLDESTVGDADACMLAIDNYEPNSVVLVKKDSGVFGGKVGIESWYLKTKEAALEDSPDLDIPETVKYVVVYPMELS